MKHALIISDTKPGHVNQSIALCKHLGLEYDLLEVAYKSRAHKSLSYLLDRLGLRFNGLYAKADSQLNINKPDVVISAGSTTYYANKLLAWKLQLPNIAILHPKGYRLDFTHILCPAYDHPPKRPNITEIPLNLCAADPAFFTEKTEEFKTRHTPEKPAVGIIIGGPNAVSELDAPTLKKQLQEIFEQTPDHEHWLTTSRRTPPEIEALLQEFKFDYQLINSQDPYNPVPAFIQLCDRLCVTSDSASMISECASFGTAKVEILMNRQRRTPNKFEELIKGLAAQNALRIYDGTLGRADHKIDLGPRLRTALKNIR